jgi:hypothetical protein
MATFGGVELLSNFQAVFTFLFMFAVSYGVLSSISIFGDKSKTVNPVIAFTLAILSTFAPFMVNLISMMSPMFIIFMFAIFFIMVLLKFLGVDDSMITSFFNGSERYQTKQKRMLVYWVIIIVLILVVLIPVSIQFGDEVGPYVGGGNSSEVSSGTTSSGNPDTATDSFSANLGATLFHPKVVGAFLIILLASLAVRQLSLED